MLPFRFIEYTVKGKNFKIFYDDDNDGKKGFHKRQNLSNHSSRCEYIQSNATINMVKILLQLRE